ncbi:putative T6SS immunity periplasmic lipoprotein [Enterobacteriaceae bacterium C23F]
MTMIFLLSGCWMGDRAASRRSYPILNDSLCFTVNKADVLSRYSVYSDQQGEYKTLASISRVALSYPDTCVKVPLTPGYIYATSYTLNGEHYQYAFFIDNNGNIFGTSGGD